MLFLRARSLAMGRSGARPLLAETMLAMLDAGPRPGGPRARLARRQRRPRPARPLRPGADRRGRGARRRRRTVAPPAEALAAAGIEPPVLGPKEGLALINGTDGILGMLVLALADLDDLLRVADVAAAMTHRGAARHRPRLRRRPDRAAPAARPGRERRQPAPAARGLGDRRQPPRPTTRGSRTPTRSAARRRSTARPATPRAHAERVAEARARARRSTTRWCCPTAGSSRAATSTARRSALACDFLAIAAAEVGAIAERRTDRLLDASRSHGLPPFLAADAGRRLRA